MMGADIAPHQQKGRLALKGEVLIGTWRLRSWRNVASDGSAVAPLGESPVGYIFSNHDGYMSVEIMAGRPRPVSRARRLRWNGGRAVGGD
jgi:lipocalin-like protein